MSSKGYDCTQPAFQQFGKCAIKGTWESEHQLSNLLSIFCPESGPDLATYVIRHFASLNIACRAPEKSLASCGLKPEMIRAMLCLPQISAAFSKEELHQKNLKIPSDALISYLEMELQWQDSFYFMALFLTSHYRLIRAQILFRGDNERLIIYPREVVREATACQARMLITAHNVPQGSMEPSLLRAALKKLDEALSLMGLQYIDHYQVSHQGTVKWIV